MKISKNQLCDTCRKIRPMMSDGKLSDISVEEFLDGKGNQHPFGYIIVNQAVLLYLQENGGCSSCINLLERAVIS